MLDLLLLLVSVVTTVSAKLVAGVSVDDMNLGSIILFENTNYTGFHFKMPIYRDGVCYNLDCYDNRANSAIWKLPGGNGGIRDAYLYMFADLGCHGAHQRHDIARTDRIQDMGEELAKRVSSIKVVLGRDRFKVVNCTGAALLSFRDSVTPATV